MKLSELVMAGFEVLRDADFNALGGLSHNHGDMLVMLYDMSFLGQLLENPAIHAVITTSGLAEQIPDNIGVGVCRDPMAVFYRIHQFLMEQTDFYGKHFQSEIDASARIADSAYVAPSNVRIGPQVIVEPMAVIQEGSILDEGVVVRAGTVIGGQGFESKWIGGQHFIVPHSGGVHLARGVHILSNSNVSKSVFGGFTEVGPESFIDVLVHISHNVKIGCGCKIAAGAIIAGSTTIGDNVWIGINATLSSGLTIGNDAFIAMGAAVAMNVPPGGRVMGNPARLVKK